MRIHVFVTAEVAQLVEHLVVAQVAVGSSPIFRPIRKSPRFRAGFFFFCRQVTGLEKGPALTPMAVAGTRPVWKKAKGTSSAGGGPSLMEATALAASGRAALAKAGPFAYKTSHHGAWRSMVAHLLWEQGVAGSNPVAPTIKRSRGHTTMWCDLFLFLRPMAARPQGVPAGLGKRVQSFLSGDSCGRAWGGEDEAGRQGPPSARIGKAGAWAVRTGRLIPSSGPAALPGRPSPHRTARAGGNGFSGRRVSCARR